VPFLIGAATVALGAAVLTTVHTPLTTADAGVVALPANSDWAAEVADLSLWPRCRQRRLASPRPRNSASRL
jgi:hypothetical protein